MEVQKIKENILPGVVVLLSSIALYSHLPYITSSGNEVLRTIISLVGISYGALSWFKQKSRVAFFFIWAVAQVIVITRLYPTSSSAYNQISVFDLVQTLQLTFSMYYNNPEYVQVFNINFLALGFFFLGFFFYHQERL